MVSPMTFSKAVEVYADYLKASTEDAEREILQFFNWDAPNEEKFGQDVRLVLVSAEFSKEIITSVIWLNDQGLDIRCVRLRPYALDTRVLLDVQQIIPLPEASEITIQLKKKAQESRIARKFVEHDLSKYDLKVDGTVLSELTKKALGYEVVNALLNKGLSTDQVGSVIPPGRWFSVDGEVNADGFRAKASTMRGKNGAPYDLDRYFCDNDQLFRIAGRTYALTNQWGLGDLSQLDVLIAMLPPGTVTYAKTSE
jgi:hypothetical protein